MKVKLYTLLLLLIVSKCIYSNNDITGYWHGAVDRLGSIQLVEFNFYKESDSIKGTYNIPDMGLFEEPVTEIDIAFPNMKFRTFMGYFDARYDTLTGEITGTNKKWDPSINIHLKKMTAPVLLFNREYITFYNKEIKIAGTLFKPFGKITFPVVILIHGADEPQSRRNWRYRYFAYFLAEHGYGALIYDKRGIDSSTGNNDADFYELAEDVSSGIKYLMTREDVKKDKIGVLGASRGGWVAEICAAKIDNTAFAVLFLGPSVSVWEQQMDAVEYHMKQENYSIEAIDSALQNNKQYFEAVNNKEKWDSFQKTLAPLQNKEWKQYLQLPESYNDSDMVWWRKNNYDPEEGLKNVKCPVLSIFGEDDVLVPPERNFEKMQKYLSQSGQQFEIKIIPGLPHNIHFNQTLRGGEWNFPEAYWVWPKRSIVLEENIINWLKNVCSE
ncbi:MAG: alpha/beta hydrolase [Ignavibacteriae bacterium]|nr:MAG: alpha/beta hydrolase [Ignavibacteriota bacterium]